MHTVPPFSWPASASIVRVDEMLGVEIPLPALQRGWLHSRELVLPWNAERITEKIGDDCWLSRYGRFTTDAEAADTTSRPQVIAGFWPSGGFVELRMSRVNPLDDFPRGTLCVHAESRAAAEALMIELVADYRHDMARGGHRARVGMLNHAYGELSVERIPITAEQTVPRARVDLYYGDGTSPWVEAWIATLNIRRYGLTILSGDPGTGKTTLLRSLAHWLADSHVFYFMPAARFASVESGEVVTFWADENRSSKLRKVLILEDAEGVLLRRGEDNRERVATLLNLTDGMLGDALGLHVVCTLNSGLEDLDPALLRAGRLVAERAFGMLTAEEALRLAESLGLPPPRGERVALAEIFNPVVERKIDQRTPRKVLGFSATPQSS